jgi:hypothetical protein
VLVSDNPIVTLDAVRPESRTAENRRPVFDADPRRQLAVQPPLSHLAGLGRLCRIVPAARFDIGAALQAVQAGDRTAPSRGWEDAGPTVFLLLLPHKTMIN